MHLVTNEASSQTDFHINNNWFLDQPTLNPSILSATGLTQRCSLS